MKVRILVLSLFLLSSAQANLLETEPLQEDEWNLSKLVQDAHGLVQLDPETLLDAFQSNTLADLFMQELGEPEEAYRENIRAIGARNAGQSGSGGHDLYVGSYSNGQSQIALHNGAGDSASHVYQTGDDVEVAFDVNEDGFVDLAKIHIGASVDFDFSTGDSTVVIDIVFDFFDMKTEEDLGIVQLHIARNSESSNTMTGGSRYYAETKVNTVQEFNGQRIEIDSFLFLEQATPDVNLVLVQMGEEKIAVGGQGRYAMYQDGELQAEVQINGIPGFDFLPDSNGDDHDEVLMVNGGHYEYSQDRMLLLFDGNPNVVIGEAEAAIVDGATGDLMYELDAESGGIVAAGPTRETYIWNQFSPSGFEPQILGEYEGTLPWENGASGAFVGYTNLRGSSDREYLVVDDDNVRAITAEGEEIWSLGATEYASLSYFPEDDGLLQMNNGQPYLLIIDDANGFEYKFESADRSRVHYTLDMEAQDYQFVDSIDDKGELDFFSLVENETVNGTIYTAEMYAGQNGGLLWEKPIAIVDGHMFWAAESMEHARGDGGAGEIILNYDAIPFSGMVCSQNSCKETSSKAEFNRVMVLDGASGILLQEFKAFDDERGLNEDVGRVKQTSLGEKVEKDMPAPFALVLAGLAVIALLRRK